MEFRSEKDINNTIIKRKCIFADKVGIYFLRWFIQNQKRHQIVKVFFNAGPYFHDDYGKTRKRFIEFNCQLKKLDGQFFICFLLFYRYSASFQISFFDQCNSIIFWTDSWKSRIGSSAQQFKYYLNYLWKMLNPTESHNSCYAITPHPN